MAAVRKSEVNPNNPRGIPSADFIVRPAAADDAPAPPPSAGTSACLPASRPGSAAGARPSSPCCVGHERCASQMLVSCFPSFWRYCLTRHPWRVVPSFAAMHLASAATSRCSSSRFASTALHRTRCTTSAVCALFPLSSFPFLPPSSPFAV
jgi:hypothetical protein